MHLNISETLYKIGQFLTEQLPSRMIISWVSLFFLYLFGDITAGHYALGILIGLDTGTGVWVAAKRGLLRSSSLFIGTFRKIVMYAIFLGAIYQIVRISSSLTFLLDWALLFLGATELLSVTENLHKLGFFIPQWLHDKLTRILNQDPTEHQ